MRKELLTHLGFWLIYFAVVVVFKGDFNLSLVLLFLGGLLGVFLPDLDHFIYVYFVKPSDLTSQRVNYLVNKKELLRSVSLLYETREERRELIFHTVYFQAIMFVLMVWILSSSASYFGRALVVSFMVHLVVDQFIDIKNGTNIDGWFKNLPFKLDISQAKIAWIAATSAILLLGILM